MEVLENEDNLQEVQETEESASNLSLRDDFNQRFVKLSEGREKKVVAGMFLIMIIGFGLVLFSRHQKQQEVEDPFFEIMIEETKEARNAVPISRLKLSTGNEETLKKYEAKLLEYEHLIKSGNIDSTKMKEIEYELNKILQDVKN